MIILIVDSNFWKDKKILLTGHTGFKGSWMCILLHMLGAKIIGYSLAPYTDCDNYVLSNLSEKITDIRGDVKDFKNLADAIDKYQPEFIFHFAAQPIVKESYSDPRNTYETNVMGTLNILECLREYNSRATVIIVTTDKCYENKEQIWGYRENDRLGGYDPYSSSKACAEILVSSFRNSFFNIKNYHLHKKSIATVRAGNVIGGGDWSKDRIIPDCIRSLQANEPIKIRNPKAIRPWQHVIEPLCGYLMLAEKLHKNPQNYSGAWNFGPGRESTINVWDIGNTIIKLWGNGRLLDIHNPDEVHEASLLTLDTTKAIEMLDWRCKLSVDEALRLTVDWYKSYRTRNVYELCEQQIHGYFEICNSKFQL